MLNRKNIIELAGWYGAAAILAAYALVSFRVIESGALAYQLLNLTGALGIFLISIEKGARQPALLNIAWAAIALVAIIQIAAG